MKVPTGLFEIGSEVPCHLGYPWTLRVRGDPEHVDDSSLEHDHDHDHDHEHEHEHEQHVVAPEQHAVDVEEVGCENPLGLGGEELGPRRGAGGRRYRHRIVATLVFDTVTPSFASAPTIRR
jgi:hypothetical protein